MAIPKLELKKEYYKIFKTGVPFYDAARLIGAAHLFLGTATAEVEDKDAYWEVSGISTLRDREQMMWVLEEGKRKSHDLNQKSQQLEIVMAQNSFPETFEGLPTSKGYPALKEFDASLQYSPRGIDPLRDAVVISSQGTKPKRSEKQFLLPPHELVIASIGFSFAGYTRSGKQRTYILPIFSDRFVLSSYLTYMRRYQHNASGFVAEVLAALSILLDLAAKKLPVREFVYTRIFGRNIFSASGYLGLERLCSIWWNAVQENNNTALTLLREFRSFLSETRHPRTDEQVQSLARRVADFIANPNVDALIMIERLKSRILAASQNQNKNISGAFSTNKLLNKSEIIKEVGKMIESDLPEIPWQVSEALGKALALDEKGWMNQFTRLENAGNFAQFIHQVEHIVSRGYYREQQEKGQQLNIRGALTGAREIANRLRETSNALQNNDKTFRTFKAIFLLDVLSRQRVRSVHTEQTPAPGSVSQNVTQT